GPTGRSLDIPDHGQMTPASLAAITHESRLSRASDSCNTKCSLKYTWTEDENVVNDLREHFVLQLSDDLLCRLSWVMAAKLVGVIWPWSGMSSDLPVGPSEGHYSSFTVKIALERALLCCS